MDKNLFLVGGVPKDPLAWIRLINQMENSTAPGESRRANSLPLGQSKVVNLPPCLGGGGALGLSLDSPIKTQLIRRAAAVPYLL